MNTDYNIKTWNIIIEQLHKWINNVILYGNEKGRKRKEMFITKKDIV